MPAGQSPAPQSPPCASAGPASPGSPPHPAVERAERAEVRAAGSMLAPTAGSATAPRGVRGQLASGELAAGQARPAAAALATSHAGRWSLCSPAARRARQRGWRPAPPCYRAPGAGATPRSAPPRRGPHDSAAGGSCRQQRAEGSGGGGGCGGGVARSNRASPAIVWLASAQALAAAARPTGAGAHSQLRPSLTAARSGPGGAQPAGGHPPRGPFRARPSSPAKLSAGATKLQAQRALCALFTATIGWQ